MRMSLRAHLGLRQTTIQQLQAHVGMKGSFLKTLLVQVRRSLPRSPRLKSEGRSTPSSSCEKGKEKALPARVRTSAGGLAKKTVQLASMMLVQPFDHSAPSNAMNVREDVMPVNMGLDYAAEDQRESVTQLAMPANESDPRYWCIDSGSPNDLVDINTLPDDCADHITDADVALVLETANGMVDVDSQAPMQIPQLMENIDAYVMQNCPDVLNM